MRAYAMFVWGANAGAASTKAISAAAFGDYPVSLCAGAFAIASALVAAWLFRDRSGRRL